MYTAAGVVVVLTVTLCDLVSDVQIGSSAANVPSGLFPPDG